MPPQEKFHNAGPTEENACQEIALGVVNKGFVGDASDGKSQKASQNNNDENESFDFDDLLPHVGEFGLYQKVLFLLMIPFAFFVAWVYFTQIFITITPEQHWCWVPELENLTQQERVNLAIPKTASGSFDKCRMYAVNFTEILQQNVTEADTNWPTVACYNGWEYNFTDDDVPYKTISTELNWVCEYDSLPSIAQAVFFCGAILGGLVFGYIADKYGRVPALVGTNMIGFIAGIATAFCYTFWEFCVCRFLVGMAFDNCFTMMYILVLEYVGPKWRTFIANMSIAIFFTLATCLLPWIALAVADWRLLCIVTAAPLCLSILTPWCIPESARWLVSQDKVDKALVIMKKIEKVNKTKVDDSIYKEFTDSCKRQEKEEEESKSYSVLDLFKTPRLRKITLLLIVIWMAISLVFDGHVRNVGSLGLNLFTTFTIASFTEFPADTFLTFTLDRWGRRWLAFGSMVTSGVFSLLAITVPLGPISASFAIIGRFAVNISYNIGLQYAAELLPTVVRAQGVALIHIMGYVASILAPFVVYLANVDPILPLLILGILGIIGGCLALFLPETLNQELPQTLDDGEGFGMDQKFLDFPCSKKVTAPEPKPAQFKRSHSTRSSMRASIRGEVRSSMIHRASVRSRRSVAIPEGQEIV